MSEGRRFIRGHNRRGILHTKDVLTKMSEASKRKNLSAETLKKLSDCKKGNNNPFYNMHHTKKTLIKMSESHKGKRFTEEHKRKISEVHKGKHHAKESLIKISEVTKGENNPFYGKHHIKESRIKMSEGHMKFNREHPNRMREICRRSALARRKNSPSWFGGVPFDSKEEMQAGHIICERFGITPIEGINCHVRVNGGEIDFRPTKSLFVEYHPWDMDGLTPEQYCNKRRKLLDDNGFKDCELIVAKSLGELQGLLGDE